MGKYADKLLRGAAVVGTYGAFFAALIVAVESNPSSLPLLLPFLGNVGTNIIANILDRVAQGQDTPEEALQRILDYPDLLAAFRTAVEQSVEEICTKLREHGVDIDGIADQLTLMQMDIEEAHAGIQDDVASARTEQADDHDVIIRKLNALLQQAAEAQEQGVLPVGWQLIDSGFIDARRQELPDTRILRYFDGRQPGWAEALSPLIPQRDMVKELQRLVKRAAAADEACVTMLTGATGEGKSTILRQVVANLVNDVPDLDVVWHADLSTGIRIADLTALPENRHWLFVSDSGESVAPNIFRGLQVLRDAGRKDVHFLLSARRTDLIAAKVPEIWRWRAECNFQNPRLRGLSPDEAKGIVEAWAAYGEAGMRELAGMLSAEAAERLLVESKSETHPDEGSLFGAMLRVRFGDGLQSHVASLIDVLDSSQGSTVDLVNAFAYIAIPHADGILTLPTQVLAKAVGTTLTELDTSVIYRLADEALVARSSMAITTRHRAIAECASAVLCERYGSHYPDSAYVELAKALVEARREGPIRGDFETWEYLSRRFSSSGNRPRGLRIASVMLQAAPENIHYRTTLAQLLRESGDAQGAVTVFRETPAGVTPTRVYCYEWAASEGMAGYVALSIVMGVFSLADWDREERPSNNQAKISLSGVPRAFIPLYEMCGENVFLEGCAGAAQLGLTLQLDNIALDYLNRNRNYALRGGVADSTLDVAFERVLAGYAAAWKIMEHQPPAWVKAPDAATFLGLTRLLGIRTE